MTTELNLFCQISGKNPVFIVGFAEDEERGSGMGHGAPDIPVWFGFWQAIGKGIQYASDQEETQELLNRIWGNK